MGNIKNKKDVDLTTKGEKDVLPDVTIKKLLNNEFEMNTIGINNDSTTLVQPKEKEEPEVDKEPDVDKEPEVEYNDVNYEGRGFKSIEDAIAFISTDYFKKLGKADQKEYKEWLIK